MSELKVDTVVNLAGTGKPNFENGVTINGAATSTLNLNQYTASSSEPSNPDNGALWWDTANEKTFIYAEGEWKETIAIAAGITWGGARAVFNYGSSSNDVSNGFDYITIASTGNATDFGNMNHTSTRSRCATVSSTSRGVFGGGAHNTSTMEYITPSTLGNGTSFGNLSGNGTATTDASGCGNGTRGLFSGGLKDGSSSSNRTNVIDYITIATTGNSTDFGDLLSATSNHGGASDSTRGVWAGGAPSNSNVISYVTIASTGNATDFGDITAGRAGVSGTSDATRCLFAGGINPWPSGGNIIEYITTQTTGNGTDFGDLTVGRDMGGNSAASDGTYAVFIMGGTSSNPYTSNVLDYVTIQTAGNATDFGDSAAQAEKGGAVAGAAS